MPDHEKLFTLFNKIERAGRFSDADLEHILGIQWPPPDESNRPYFLTYKTAVRSGPYTDEISQASAVIPDTRGERRMLGLNLRPGAALTRDDVEAKYRVVGFEPASATAPEDVPDLLTVMRSWGTIVFGLAR